MPRRGFLLIEECGQGLKSEARPFQNRAEYHETIKLFIEIGVDVLFIFIEYIHKKKSTVGNLTAQ